MSRHKFIEILGPESDLYSIIYASKICVSFPFSSPSIIARELGVPTVYYLGDDSIEKYDLVHGVGFINNKFDLFDFMLSQKIIEFE
jgi:polysaccharide biosynthesis PFTS motif protein